MASPQKSAFPDLQAILWGVTLAVYLMETIDMMQDLSFRADVGSELVHPQRRSQNDAQPQRHPDLQVEGGQDGVEVDGDVMAVPARHGDRIHNELSLPTMLKGSLIHCSIRTAVYIGKVSIKKRPL